MPHIQVVKTTKRNLRDRIIRQITTDKLFGRYNPEDHYRISINGAADRRNDAYYDGAGCLMLTFCCGVVWGRRIPPGVTRILVAYDAAGAHSSYIENRSFSTSMGLKTALTRIIRDAGRVIKNEIDLMPNWNPTEIK